MTANVQKTDKSPIPAGIFGEGIEAFWYNNEKWVIANGARYRYNETPTHAKAVIQQAFMNDRQSLAYMATRMNLKNANEMFDTWYRCVVGGLDSVPDFGLKFTPDAFNNMCHDTQCKHRGSFCGRQTALKNYEVETLAQLGKGNNMKATSEHLFITRTGIRSRVDQIKEKLNANNMAELMHRSAQLGI